ncbi:MAG: hypothetical protein CMN31_07585 [Sandaracinus sp.]|nr:hypothetical protein [Sandaracinus sp.]MBJ71188.1 hypothetical protein [Sandaracinus sp.]HJL30407.1 hypothetical protein [Polyangiaceae bacterium LLY-WYZ-15_(1-7)]
MLLALALGCGAGVQRFPLGEAMWVDEGDTRAVRPRPGESSANLLQDFVDYTLLRPITRVFAVDPAGEAIDVNAFDEVPDSSWFENRWREGGFDVARALRGACDEPPPVAPWTVVSGKRAGANPGFVIEDAEGRRFVVKLDEPSQPEHATSADVIGATVYWAAGYHTPCNRIAFFQPDALEIAEGAMAGKGAEQEPLTRALLQEIVALGHARADGAVRAMASRYLPGEPLGPWRYEGMREDDPNDVVPHEDRRELRGSYVVASWIDHWDTRSSNTLRMWIDPDGDGRGHVRHNFLDWGDVIGTDAGPLGIPPRRGHTYNFHPGHVFTDFVTLGAMPRPWRHVERGPAGELLGYFDAERFDPEEWYPSVLNPAFQRATERDMAWGARRVAAMGPAFVAALVASLQLADPGAAAELERVLLARREKILKRWFRRLSPLTEPRLEAGAGGSGTARLCLRDLAVATGIVEWDARPYWTRAWRVEGERRVEALEPFPLRRRAPDRVCALLPETDAGYLIVDLTGQYGEGDRAARPARVHLARAEGGGLQIVGLERPYELTPPGR